MSISLVFLALQLACLFGQVAAYCFRRGELGHLLLAGNIIFMLAFFVSRS